VTERRGPQRARGGLRQGPGQGTLSDGPEPGLLREVRDAAGPRDRDAAADAFARAVTALAAGDVGVAIEAAREAKRRAPRASPVREVLGVALYRAGTFDQALSELQAYRRMSGRMDQDHLIADAYRGLGRPERAVPVAREAVAADLAGPLRAEAAIVGASALADMGRFEEAVALLRTVPTRPDMASEHDLRVWYVLADVLLRSGRADEAERMFRLVVRHDPEAFDAAERLAAIEGNG